MNGLSGVSDIKYSKRYFSFSASVQNHDRQSFVPFSDRPKVTSINNSHTFTSDD